MIDPPSLADFNDLRVTYIACVWFSIIVLCVSALHRCSRNFSSAPILYHFSSHVAMGAEVFAIIYAASSEPSYVAAKGTPEWHKEVVFAWLQRGTILLWLVLSRWMYYFVPRAVVGFSVLLPILSEWARISLHLLSDEDIHPAQLAVDCVVVCCQILSFCSVLGWNWLFISEVNVLFRQIPEVSDNANEQSDDERPRQRPGPYRSLRQNRTRVSDTLPLENSLSVETASEDMKKHWSSDGSIIWTLWSRWKVSLLLLALVRLVYDLLGLLPSFLLRVLVDNLSTPNSSTGADLRTSVVIIALLMISSVAATFFRVHFNLKLQKIALYNRGLLSDCINRHALRARAYHLQSASGIATSQGDVINHMTVDTQRVADCLGGFYDAWALPLQVAFTLYLLYIQVNFAFVAGILITIALIPVNMVLAKKISKVNSSMLSHNDERVLRINEVMNNIVYVKMCGWCPRMVGWITEPREKYMACLRWVKMLDALCVFFWATTPVFVSLATFAMYIVLGGELTPGRAVAALSLFNALILPLNAYPWVINGSVEAYVSLKRLDKFILPFIRKEQRLAASGVAASLTVPLDSTDDDLCGIQKEPYTTSHNDSHSSSDDFTAGGINAGEKRSFLRRGRQSGKRRKARHSGISGEDDEGNRTESQRRDERSIPSIFDSAKKAFGATVPPSDDNGRLHEVSDVLVDIEHARYSYRPNFQSLTAIATSSAVSSRKALVDDAEPDPIAPLSTSQEGTLRVGFDDEGEHFSLHVPSLLCKKGQLVTVVGTAGSGKSTLLGGIAGELWRFGGKQRVGRGSVALVEQHPFLFSGSIKSNILCGAPYQKEAFEQVLKRVALDADVNQMDERENSVIGDRGIGLSGGQKFRVALARALYADKDLYLIDDGLGALDIEVANHIVDHVLVHLAVSGKCVIVVTHSPDLISRSDRTFLLQHKRVALLSQRDRDSYLHAIVASLSRGNEGASPKQAPSVAVGEEKEGEDNGDDLGDLDLDQDALRIPVQIAVPLEDVSPPPMAQPAVSTELSASEIGREVTKRGALKWTALFFYLRHVGWGMAVVVVVFIAAMQVARNLSDWYVAVWASSKNSTGAELIRTLGIIAAANGALAMVRGVSFAVAGLLAARNIHKNLLVTLMQASFHFFSTTSPGRIINRLSRDMYNIDDSLPFIVNILLAQFFLLVGSVVIIVANSSWVIVVVIAPVCVAYFLLQKPFRRANREIKRLESAARSPIIDDLRRILEGGSILRAMGSATMNHFLRRARFDLGLFLRTNLNMCVLQAWFGIRLQLVGCVILGAVGLITVYYHNSDHAAALGLALAYVAPLTSYVAGLLSAAADTEKQFVSVERVLEYMNAESESKSLTTSAAPVTELRVSGSVWPLFGTVQFCDVSLRYEVDGPLILRNVTFQVDAGEKVAIVGRTGAGKTSLFIALLRLLKLQKGTILVDSEDVRRIDPEELRQRLAIFPQDPFIFHSSVRENVDPFGQSTDDEVSSALTRVHLGHLSLNYVVEEGGKNLSTGQKYLLALARVSLLHSCILLLDEPSAKIDKESDALLWQLVDDIFKDCTVITITHNLDHIDWFDKVIVMERGTVLAVGTPQQMRNEKIGPFASLGNTQ